MLRLLYAGMLNVQCWKQEMADEAEGQNVLIVTHGDGVNASVSRLRPWAVVYPVLHTGFTIARRDRTEGVR